jgi:hypothetical protein
MKAFLQPSLRGLSGKMGDWVYRYSKDKEKTYIGEKPVRTKDLSEAQVAHNDRFSDASQFAVEVMDDPVLREFYETVAEERDMKIRNLAIADFFNVPSFKPLGLTNYKGRVGDTIVIRMVDEIGLVSMHVSIDKGDGTDIEKGQAVETSPRSGKWIYTATAPVATGTDIFIEVVATDYVGKKVTTTENPVVGEEN